MKQDIRFLYIKINRFLLRRKFLRIMSGPLKGLKWTTSMNYEYLTGTYIGDDEKQVIAHVLDRPGSVFYDIGANVGYFSITVGKMLPGCKVIAFEPIPQHIESLRTHLRLNGIGNVEVHALAVADTSRELEFSNLDGSEGNTYKNESALYKNSAGTLKVMSVSVDDFVAAGNQPPTLLKIDVEGAELDVLKGAVGTIGRYKPVIMLATHDCHIAGIKEKCLLFLKEAGYTTSVVGAHNKHVPGLEDFLAKPLHK